MLRKLALVCIAISLKYASSEIAFDCGSEKVNYTSISLMDVAECDYTKDDYNETVVSIQLLQKRESEYVNVFSCRIEVNYVAWYCGMHSHASPVEGGIASRIYHLSASECRDMHSTRKASIYGKEILVTKFNETQESSVTFAGYVSRDGTCEGSYFHDGYREYAKVVVHGNVKILFSTHVALRSLNENRISLKSGLSCSYDDVACMDPYYGYTFWNERETYPCSEDSYHVIYEGEATKVETISRLGNNEVSIITMFSVTRTDEMFTLRTIARKNVCQFVMYQTEHPKYVINEAHNNNFYFKRETIPSEDLDLFLYTNSKITHVSRMFNHALKKMYLELSLASCENERQNLKTMLSLAYIAPNVFAYEYMRKPGFTAVQAGEVIHLVQCVPVPVTPRENTECTIEYPVLWQNESFFVTPRNHLLQRKGTPVPCSSHLTPEYQFGNQWYSLNLNMMKTVEPKQLSPKKRQQWNDLNLGNLMTAGIYTYDQIAKLRKQIMFSHERRAMGERIMGALNNEQVDTRGIASGFLLDKQVIAKTVKDFWLKTWGWMRFAAEFSSVFMTIYLIIRILIYIGNSVLRCKVLHSLFGTSFYLLGSLFSGLFGYMVHTKTGYMPEGNRLNKKYDCEEGIELRPTAPAFSSSQTNDDAKLIALMERSEQRLPNRDDAPGPHIFRDLPNGSGLKNMAKS